MAASIHKAFLIDTWNMAGVGPTSKSLLFLRRVKSISLERKNYVKYLGVLIDETLSWKYHIVHLASKISKTIGLIARLRHFVPLATVHHIYISLIQPYLLYGIVAWGRAAKIHTNKILLLQKRALCLMYFGDYKFRTVPYFLSSHFLPLDFLYFKSVAVLMHDVSNNLSPPNIANLFISKASIHSYKTRSSSRGDYFVKPSRLDNKSFSRNGVKIWNSLPCEIRHLSKNNFKIKIQRLSEENDYIDLSVLITKIY